MNATDATDATPPQPDDIRAALQKLGIPTPQHRLESLAEAMAHYRPRIDALYDIDVEAEESAAVFDPAWDAAAEEEASQ